MRFRVSTNKDELLNGNTKKLFLHYFWPCITATSLIAATYLIDAICVSQKTGESGLAALNVAVPFTGLFYALGYLFSFGSSNLFSGSIGAGDYAAARRYYATAAKALLAVSLAIMALGLTFNQQISWYLCKGADFYRETQKYLFFVFLFTPMYCFETFYSVFIRNDGSPDISVLGTTANSFVNIALDFLFVWGLNMGVAGASLAAGFALVAGCLIHYSATRRPKSNLKLKGSEFSGRYLLQIIRIGFSNFIRELSGSLLVLIVNVILLDISGETAVAAYGVIANLGNAIIVWLAGVTNTIQPLISINFGAGSRERVQRFLRLGIRASLILSLAYVAFAECFPGLLVAAFLDDPTPALVGICYSGIRIIAPGYAFAAVAIVYNVYFESTQRANYAFWTALIRGLIAPVVCIIVFVELLGINGIWLSFLAAEIGSLAIALILKERVSRQLRPALAQRRNL